jgi:hypothetical protein
MPCGTGKLSYHSLSVRRGETAGIESSTQKFEPPPPPRVVRHSLLKDSPSAILQSDRVQRVSKCL